MATLTQNGFETGQTAGSGIQNVDGIVASANGVISNANPAHGTLHWRANNPGTAVANFRFEAMSSRYAAITFALCATSAAVPGTEQTWGYLSGLNDSPLNAVQITLLTTGALRIRTKGTTRYTTASSICDGTWRRYAIAVDAGDGVTAATGQVRAAYYPLGSATATGDSGLISSIDTTGTTGSIGYLRLGKIDTSTNGGVVDIDDIQRWTGTDAQAFLSTTAFPVWATNIAPTCTLTPSQATLVEPGQLITLTGATTDSDGTSSITSITQTDGSPTVTLSGSGATRTFVAPATLTGATLTFRATATDDDGATTTADATVAVLPASIHLKTASGIAGAVAFPKRV